MLRTLLLDVESICLTNYQTCDQAKQIDGVNSARIPNINLGDTLAQNN